MFSLKSKIKKFNKMDMIVALYIFGVMTMTLMGAKIMPFGSLFGLSFNISVAIFLLPLMFVLTDVVNEIYGRTRAKQLVWLGVGVQILLIPFILLVISLPHAERFEPLNDDYNTIFSLSARFAIASLTAYTIAGLLDVLIFARLKKSCKERFVWLRSNLSNFINALVDTAVFMTVAFYGVFISGFSENALLLAGLILPYWLIKCIMSIVSTPLVYAGIKWLRKRKKKI